MKARGIREQRILDKFGEKELLYCRNMSPNDINSYHIYVQKNLDDYISPSEWFNSLKKHDNKMEEAIKEVMGEQGLMEYLNLSLKERWKYYTYLFRRVKQNKKQTRHLTPREWYINKEDNKLNMDFAEIAERLKLDEETVRKVYHEAIRKIKVLIDRHPKFQDLIEYL